MYFKSLICDASIYPELWGYINKEQAYRLAAINVSNTTLFSVSQTYLGKCDGLLVCSVQVISTHEPLDAPL
jgi:hypothetical protein